MTCLEVAGLRGDGQLLTELGDVSGGKGWRSSLVRLVEKGGVSEVQAVCVVSKARWRARSGKAFRMKALAVQKGLRGRGLAVEAFILKRLQVELGGWLGQITGWWPTWLPAWQRRVWASMPDKAGLVEMESGSGTRGHQRAEEAEEGCRWRQRNLSAEIHYGFSIFDFFSPHEPRFFSMVDEKTRKWQNG